MQSHLRAQFPTWALLGIALCLPVATQAHPAKIVYTSQADPATQCAEGVQLFHESKATEARPLLEAGFANRSRANFADPEGLGHCALALGVLRNRSNDWNGALETYTTALKVFRQTGSRALEAIALNNIGQVQDAQGRYAEALDTFQQALTIRRALGDRQGEGITLSNIGAVYEGMSHYPEALEALEQALSILREVTDRQGEGSVLNTIGLVHYAQGRYTEALDSFQQALTFRREVSDQQGESTTLSNLGATYDKLGRHVDALESYYRALNIVRQTGDRPGEGAILSSIGVINSNQGRHTEALNAFEQALPIQRETGDQSGAAATLTNIGGVHSAQGRYSEAIDAYQQALDIRRKTGDRRGEGAALNNIGLVYDHQGRYAEALESYQQALTIQGEIGDDQAKGIILNNIATINTKQGRYIMALESFQQALTIQREIGDLLGEATTLANIGVVYEAQSRPIEALETYRQALSIRRAVGDRSGEAHTLSLIGEFYSAQERYGDTLDTFQQALPIQRAAGERTAEANTFNDIGMTYYRQGRYPEALAAYRQALTIRQSIGDRAGQGLTLNNIGMVYQEQNRDAEALDAFQQARAIIQEVGDRPGEAIVLNNIGLVYRHQERYVEAVDAFQESLAIAREIDDRQDEGIALGSLGLVFDNQERYAEALEAYQQALAIAREVGNRQSVGINLHNIGVVYERQRQADKALASYVEALDVLEIVRAHAGSERGRAAFIARYALLYHRAVRLYHQQGQDDLAFITSERSRARAFLDSLTTGQVQLSDDAARDLLERERNAYAARQTLQDALARARASSLPDSRLVADLEQQLATAEREYQAAKAAIEQHGAQLATLVPRRMNGVLDVAAIQKLLDPQTTLIAFFVLDEQTLAFLITHDSFQTTALPVSRKELADQIRALRAFATLHNPHPPSAVQLYDWLIAPLEEKFSLLTPHLAIVPHDVLHYLPFAALTDGQRYLVDDYALTTLPSASALRFIKENVRSAIGPPLIVGNPDVPDLPSLTFAEREARAIGQLYGVTPLIGAAATAAAVHEQAPQAGVLHLAAHGSYNVSDPLESTIALAPTEDGKESGDLTVADVYRLNLRTADLVVLSACQTQINEVGERSVVSAGDEVVGMTRAFFFAGTPSVIATLWSVDDEATGLLMERFYTHLRVGMGKASALRQAQLDVRAKYPNPYYWSGFVLSGDAGTIQADERVPWWGWLAGSAAVGLLVTGLVVWRTWHRRFGL
jgi:tetratricopeptide (TPR) repeat protein/CHAT domain-containing protein